MSTLRTVPVLPAPRSPHRAGPREWCALAVLILPVLLVSVDNTALSFALPDISATLEPTGTQLLWIVDVYPLMLAGLLITMGTLGDRLGRRRMLVAGSVGFGVVSLLAAYASTPETLIGARALLGVFGATLMPSTLALLRTIFVDRGQRRLAIAIWAAGFAGGGALGPILGGWLLEHYWWGSIFLLNVPLIALLIPLVLLFVPESRDPAPGRVDALGMVLSLLTMLPLVYAVKSAAEHGLGGATLQALGTGVVFGIAFVRRQATYAHPMIDLALFRNPVFAGAITANLLSILGFAGFLFFVAQFLQLVLGMSPLAAGLVLVPGLVASIASGLLAVPLVRRVRPHLLVSASFALSASGYVVIAFVGDVPTAVGVMGAFVAVGFGIGLAETLTNDLIIASAPVERSGAASAISETAYEVGATLGTTVLGSVLLAVYRSEVDVPSTLSPESRQLAGETLGGAVEVVDRTPGVAATQMLESAHLAFDVGVQTASTVAIGIALAAAAVSYATLRRARVHD